MASSDRCIGIIVLGVSGAGKSTVGRLLAATLGWEFIEADDLHTGASKEKMAVGIGLTDKDRQPWLGAINSLLQHKTNGWVLACSALKHVYRDTLTQGLTGVELIWLQGNEALLRLRLRRREGHFSGESLLESQLADLQPPTDCLQLDVVHDPQALLTQILMHLWPGLAVNRPVLISDS